MHPKHAPLRALAQTARDCRENLAPYLLQLERAELDRELLRAYSDWDRPDFSDAIPRMVEIARMRTQAWFQRGRRPFVGMPPRHAQCRRAPRRVGVRVARHVAASSSADDPGGGSGDSDGPARPPIIARCASDDGRLANAA